MEHQALFLGFDVVATVATTAILGWCKNHRRSSKKKNPTSLHLC